MNSPDYSRREFLQTPIALKGGIDRLKFMHPYFSVTSCLNPSDQKEYPLGTKTPDSSWPLNEKTYTTTEGVIDKICLWHKADHTVHIIVSGEDNQPPEDKVFDGNGEDIMMPGHNIKVTIGDCTTDAEKVGSCPVRTITKFASTQSNKNTVISRNQCIDINREKNKQGRLVTVPVGTTENRKNNDGTLNAVTSTCKGSAIYTFPNTQNAQIGFDLWKEQNQLRIRSFNPRNGDRLDEVLTSIPFIDDPTEVAQPSNIGVWVRGCATTDDCTIDRVGPSEQIKYNPIIQGVNICDSAPPDSTLRFPDIPTTDEDTSTAGCLGTLYFNGKDGSDSKKVELYKWRVTPHDPYNTYALVFPGANYTSTTDQRISQVPGHFNIDNHDLQIDPNFHITVDGLPPYPSSTPPPSKNEIFGINLQTAWTDVQYLAVFVGILYLGAKIHKGITTFKKKILKK